MLPQTGLRFCDCAARPMLRLVYGKFSLFQSSFQDGEKCNAAKWHFLLQSVPTDRQAKNGLMAVVPGIVLRLDPTLGGGFVPDLLLNDRFLLRRVCGSLDRRLGLRRDPGPGRGLRLDHWLCGRGIERVQRFFGGRLQPGHEGFLVQALFLGKSPTTRDHAVLDSAQAAVLLGDQLGPGFGSLQLAL